MPDWTVCKLHVHTPDWYLTEQQVSYMFPHLTGAWLNSRKVTCSHTWLVLDWTAGKLHVPTPDWCLAEQQVSYMFPHLTGAWLNSRSLCCTVFVMCCMLLYCMWCFRFVSFVCLFCLCVYVGGLYSVRVCVCVCCQAGHVSHIRQVLLLYACVYKAGVISVCMCV